MKGEVVTWLVCKYLRRVICVENIWSNRPIILFTLKFGVFFHFQETIMWHKSSILFRAKNTSWNSLTCVLEYVQYIWGWALLAHWILNCPIDCIFICFFHSDRVQKPQFCQSHQKLFSKGLKNASLNVAGSKRKQQAQPVYGLLDHSLSE